MSPNEARAREGLPPYEGGEQFENPNVQAGGAADDGGEGEDEGWG